MTSWRGGVVRGGKRHEGEMCCSFCGKEQDEVAQLIAGPNVFICNECIALCREILAESGLDA